MWRLLAALVLLAGCASPLAPAPPAQGSHLVFTASNDGVNPEWFHLAVLDNGTTVLSEQRSVLPGQQTTWTLPMAPNHVLHYDISAANSPAQEPGWGWRGDLEAARCAGGTWTVAVTVGYLPNGELSSHIDADNACSLD